ncbi:caspase-7 (C14 family), partial [Reticulomyxa filosa]
KEFENNEPTFKIRWISLQQPLMIGKAKSIKNALVIMIAISEYEDNKKWPNLESAKDTDINNFKYIFEQELNYEFVCNKEPKMNKDDVNEFLVDLIAGHKLHKNKKQYDALIIIISGHGDEGDVLVMSDGEYLSIDEIKSSFDCNRMRSLKDCPKIFIIDICRGMAFKQKKNKEKNKTIYITIMDF